MFLMDAEARFMVPMYAKKRKRASDEPRSARFLGVEIPGSAAAPAAVRCATRRTLHQKDELAGSAPSDGKPTARAPLAASEAGALPDSN